MKTNANNKTFAVINTAAQQLAATEPGQPGPSILNSKKWLPRLSAFLCLLVAAPAFAAPILTSISPTSGTTGGGTTVTLTGTGFIAGATVTIDGVSATGCATTNTTTIACKTPVGGTTGAKTVAVTQTDGTSSKASLYTYVAPTVTAISPTSGTTGGKTLVTLTGTGLVTGATVTIDAVAATGCATVNATTITCTTPTGSSTGAKTVVMTQPGAGGTVTKTSFYTYVAPTVTAISPTSGTTGGGTTVTLTGTGFVTGATVTIDAVAATGCATTNATTITCKTPVGATTGAKTVVMTQPGAGGTVTKTSFYTYAAPTVTAISPTSGTTGGGTTVTLTGTGFVSGATVTINALAASGCSTTNATTITCTATPTSTTTGAKTVVMTQPGGGGTVTKTSFYTYVAPTLTGISPASGTTGGGTAVTLTGTGFVAGATVTIGGAAATGCSTTNATTIACTATPSSTTAGAKDVVVTQPGMPVTKTGAYTYVAPTLTAISPTSGTAGGGTAVTLTGTGFVAGATVTIGGAAASGCSTTNATTITCTATPPSTTVGAKDVVVTQPGMPVTKTGAYTYVAPTLTGISSTSGTTGGSTISWTLTGTGFVNGATVTVGGGAATGCVTTNVTTITCATIPPSTTAGAKDVVVTQPGMPATKTGAYTYVAPTLTGISSTSGTTGGSTISWTLTGTGFVNGATVTVGGGAATGCVTMNATTIACATIPPSTTAGAKDVVVTQPGMPATKTGAYTYVAPTLTGISSTSGTTGGSTISWTLTGTGFVNGATVTVGGGAATGCVTTNVTTIACATIPSSTTAGAKDVVVTQPGMPVTKTGAYTYVAPTLAGISPASGTTAGSSTLVTLTGTGFVNGTAVTIGGAAATGCTTVNATTITCATVPPSATAGAKDVVVTQPGVPATLVGGYTYKSPPSVSITKPLNNSTIVPADDVLIATIATAGATQNIAVNPATNKIYQVNGGSAGLVTVIDGLTNATTTIAVGGYPKAIAINVVTNKIYVTNTNDNTVTVIDGTSGTVDGTIAVGAYPRDIAVDSQTNKIYVANGNSGNVTVIDGLTNSTTTVSVGGYVQAVKVNPNTNQIYVVSATSTPNIGYVTVIDGGTNNVITTIAVGSTGNVMEINPVTNMIYVGTSVIGSDNVSVLSTNITVIDGASNTILTTVPVGTATNGIAINTETNKIYVSSANDNDTVIDGATNVGTVLYAGSDYHTGIAANPITNKIYVTNHSDPVSVINGVNNAYSQLAFGVGGNYLAINPVTNRIYVGSSGGPVLVIGSTTVTLEASAADDGTISRVEFYNGATLLGTDTTSSYNPWNNTTHSFVWADIAPGTYTVTAVAYDNDNLSTTSSPVTFTVGTPTVTVLINSLGNNNEFSAPVDVPLTAFATDSAGTVVKVDYFDNGTWLGTGYPGDYAYTWSQLPLGNHVVIAVATDDQGRTAVSAAVNIKVNANILPMLVFTAPTDGQTITAPVTERVIANIDTGADGSQGTTPNKFAVNRATNKTYVLTNSKSSVTVLDNNETSTTIALGSIATAIAVNPATNKIYATKDFYNPFTYTTTTYLMVIDGNSNNIISTQQLSGGSVNAIAINPVTNKIYLPGSGSTTLVIDGSTDDVNTAMTFSANGVLALNTSTNKIYVSNGNDVKVIDGVTSAITPVALSGVEAFAINPVTNIVYTEGSSGVSAINGTNIVPIIPFNGDLTRYIAVNEVTNKAYVVNCVRDADTHCVNSVTVIDGLVAGATIGVTTPTIGGNNDPHGIAINTVTNRIYMTFANDDAYFDAQNIYHPAVLELSELDGLSNIVSEIPITFFSGVDALAVNPVSNKVYVGMTRPPYHDAAYTYRFGPTVNVVAPASDVAVTANAWDVDGSISHVDFFNSLNMAPIGVPQYPDPMAPLQFGVTWKNLISGSYGVTANAYDNQQPDVATTRSITFTLNPSPVVSITSQLPITFHPQAVMLSSTANAISAGSTNTIVRVDYYDFDTWLGAATLTSGVYNFTWANQQLGSHQISAVAVDALGRSTTSAVINVTVN